MRLTPNIVGFATVAFCALPLAAPSQAESYDVARAEARHELKLAKLELQHYLQVEYPRQRRYLDAEIKLIQAEMAALRSYAKRSSSFRDYRATQKSYHDRRLCLLEAELRYRDLLAERHALTHAHSVHWQMLQAIVHQARLRVREIERGTETFTRIGRNREALVPSRRDDA